MVSAARAFAAEPPREPLTSLAAIKRDFKWRYQDTKKTDQVIEWCRSAPTLRSAIDRAVRARDENGKHHNHQSKVDLNARLELGQALSTVSTRGFRRMDFDDLHDLIDEIKPYGIGPVTVYDVAVRVGAYLGIEPQSVYVHAGVRKGLKALEEALNRKHGTRAYLDGAHKLPRVPMSMFPAPWNKMRADDVEDMLCTYREVFGTW